jgi:hypothetical protein
MNTQILKQILDRVLNRDSSISITDSNLIKSFTRNPDFPYLVSFPRTGSHWLRMIMELYFRKPSLVRAFYFKDATDFTCYHTHDMDLDLQRENVIYLYRNPVETVYSQLKYYKENIDDESRRRYWSEMYAHHLSKWLIHDDFTKKKTVITYEGMKKDLHKQMINLCEHFGEEYNRTHLELVEIEVSKEQLKKKTKHDQQVVNLTDTYTRERDSFKSKYSQIIYQDLYSIDPEIEKLFEDMDRS